MDHAHIAFVRGINNPIGIKISDKATPEELLEIIDAVNPDNIPGRVTIIVRMGAEKLREKQQRKEQLKEKQQLKKLNLLVVK